jgi:diguanylate cyclase (GGDEF)-like protein
VLRETIRPYDVCVRYAGDEFIIVLAGCGAEDAEAKRLELQDAVDNLKFEASAGRPVRLSLSIGAAVFPEDGETYEALLATADGRMYRDKKSRKRPGIQPPRLAPIAPVLEQGFAEGRAVPTAVQSGARLN